MRYAFKPNLFARQTLVEVTSDSIKVLAADGRPKRQLGWKELKSIQVYDRGVAKDPERGKFTMVDFILRPRMGRSLRICSASYVGPGRPIEATNQSEAFLSFCDAIKRFASEAKPDLPMVFGSRGASVAFAVVSLLSLGLCAFAVFAAMTSKKPLLEIGPLLLLAAVVGIVMSWMTGQCAIAYWPSWHPLRNERS